MECLLSPEEAAAAAGFFFLFYLSFFSFLTLLLIAPGHKTVSQEDPFLCQISLFSFFDSDDSSAQPNTRTS